MTREVWDYPDHRPVLYQEVLNSLSPSSPGMYLDGTLGAGGHAKGILAACAPEGQLLGLDVDPFAISLATHRLESYASRCFIRQGSYAHSADFLRELGWPGLDGALLDLGVSSMQLDHPERGFSFRQDGPLDMRFDSSQGPSAADLVNNLPEKELADIIWQYGEERFSRRVAKAIVHARPFASTLALAEVVRKAVGRSQEKQDPATRTFQSLRIAVNDELKTIEQAIPGLIALLKPHGRVAIISVHSLEDRLVKQAFQRESRVCVCPPEQPVCTCGHKALIRVLTHRPIMATGQETTLNPRARSARLRVAERIN